MNASLTPELLNVLAEMQEKKTAAEREAVATKYFGTPIGAGSSRKAFRVNDSLCLKVAINEAGVAQNKKETKTKFKKHPLMAKVLEVDSDYTWVVMELCRMVNNDDIQNLLGIDTNTHKWAKYAGMFFNMLMSSLYIVRQKLPKWISDGYKTLKRNDELIQAARSTSPKLDDFLNVVEDWDTRYNPSLYLLNDLEREENWGIAIRNGEETFIAIDYGFDVRVWSQYYKDK